MGVIWHEFGKYGWKPKEVALTIVMLKISVIKADSPERKFSHLTPYCYEFIRPVIWLDLTGFNQSILSIHPHNRPVAPI
jgi:hypothetical protein